MVMLPKSELAGVARLVEKQNVELIKALMTSSEPMFEKLVGQDIPLAAIKQVFEAMLSAVTLPLLKQQQDTALKLADCYSQLHQLAIAIGVVAPTTTFTHNHNVAIGTCTALAAYINESKQ